MIRGNHELQRINKDWGFFAECTERLGAANGMKVWEAFNE